MGYPNLPPFSIHRGQLLCLRLFICLGPLFFSHTVWPHPVSYRGSKGMMGYHSPILTHNQLNYSFRYWGAAGIHHIRRPNMLNRYGTFATANFLLKRWNGTGLQANIYGNLGMGSSRLGPSEQFAGLGLLQFDIENRDYYFLIKNVQIRGRSRIDLNQTVVRLGFSPYVEKFSGLHAWWILEWQNSNFTDGDNLSDMTPFLRLFYKNFLFEIGQSFDGITKINYIIHF